MTILVTGAAGVLGHLVARALASAHDLRTVDVRPADAPGAFTPADLADYERVLPLVEGCDVVIHCAALHPWKPYTDEQYLDSNVKACFQVAKACSEAGVSKLIFTSSIVAVGYAGEYAPEAMPIPEDAPVRNRDTYSLTKTLAEEIVRHFHRRSGLNAFCLRPPCFIPRAGLAVGLGLLSGHFTDPRDIARAHVLAVDAPVEGVETCFLPPGLPYTPADIAEGQTHPAAVAERYFPGVTAWFAGRGLEIPPLFGLYSDEQAKRRLGWEPEYTFARWWAEHKAEEPPA